MHILFAPAQDGQQTATVYRATGVSAEERGAVGAVIIPQAPVSFGAAAQVTTAGAYTFFAGLRSDPFFVNPAGFFNNFQSTGHDVNADKNVLGMVLEMPNHALGASPHVGIWARTLAPVHGTLQQVDQFGHSGTASFFRDEAAAQGITNVEFRTLDIRTAEADTGFDLVYARFLLTHLADLAGAIAAFGRALRPGGLLIVEDIDFRGIFAWPETAAFQRYCELYCAVVRTHGRDPDIGPRLPILLAAGGFTQVEMHVVQPMAMQGEAKLINPITLENIADAIMQDNLTAPQEIDALVDELYAFAADPRTVARVARVIHAWGMWAEAT